MPSDGAYSGLGRIELSLSLEDVIQVVEDSKLTKASVTPTFEELEFTIDGISKGGASIHESIFFTEGESKAFCYFRSGTYTIRATYTPSNADFGAGDICFGGTTEEFTLETGGSTGPLTIEMKPTNARVSVVFDSALKDFYDGVGINFTSPREVVINSKDADGEGVCTVYFEAGRVASYSISATAMPNSGASAISVSGMYLPNFAPGADPILLEAGKAYTIHIRVVPGGIAIFLDDDQKPVYTTEELWNGIFS